MSVHIEKRTPKIIVHRTWTLENEEPYSEVENPDVPEALMAFAEEVRGNGGARIAVTTDFGMKDFGNGASGSVTISMDCNQDDKTMQGVAQALSQWSIGLTEQHWRAADQKFQQMYFERHPEKAPMVHQTPPPFKP